MSQWTKLLASLTPKQRYSIAAAAILVIAGLFGFSRWKHERDFRPLLTGIAPEDAGGVVQKLKEAGVEYRISEEGGAILVPSDKLPEMRLQMAAAGLPKSGRIGFELFDRTNLGATDFAEHINYGRALEGELERSIRSIREVEQARVHITFPKESLFLESRMPAKASVLLHTRSGASVAPQNVVAIRHLVASAVEGLAPAGVSVLDMRGNLLSRPQRGLGANDISEEHLEYRQKLERDVTAKLHSTLDPLVGADKLRASVAIDCDLTSGEESQETYDPERTIMLTTQKTEEGLAGATAAGVPGTPSNLPRPSSSPSTGGSGLVRRTESVSYQPSKTVRHVRMPQGRINRMSVALLIDHAVRWETKNGQRVRTVVPHSPEALKTIRDVASAAVGLNSERGDQMVVESLAFESTVAWEPNQAPDKQPANPQTAIPPISFNDPRVLIAAAAGGLLLLGLMFLAFRAKKKKRRAAVTMTPAIPGSSEPKGLPQADGDGTRNGLSDQADARALLEEQQKLKLRPPQTQKGEVLVAYARDAVTANAPSAAGVIRNWLREE
jgi:flagellar M-ring protein FliF